jgi:DNA-binding NtrC family response regulator
MNAFPPFHFASLADNGILGGLVGVRERGRTDSCLAKSNATVLIGGETGTGKDLVSRAIHGLGPRAARPSSRPTAARRRYAARRPALWPRARGVHGPHERHEDLIAHAAQETMLLDEVDTFDAMSPGHPVAGSSGRPVPAARLCNGAPSRCPFSDVDERPLNPRIQTGSFRADLYFRLFFSLTLPPPRERCEDILPLAQHVLTKHSHRAVSGRHSGAGTMPLAFDWPNNSWELESRIVRGLTLAQEGLIEVNHLGLPGEVADAGRLRIHREGPDSYKVPKRRVLDSFERQYLARKEART